MIQPKIRVTVSWVLIIAVIVLIQITIYRKNTEAPSVDSALIMQIQMSGKYFVGIKQLSGQNPRVSKRLNQLEQGIQNNQARNKHLSTIPIIFELSGREAAVNELKLMLAELDSVIDGENLPLFHQLYHDGSSSLESNQLLILKNYGWVGRLALSQDKPDSAPERKAVLKSALIMVILLVLLTILIMAALAGGVVLIIIAIVQVVKGKIKSNLFVPAAPGSLLLETFAIYLVLSTALPLLMMIIAPGFSKGGILMTVIAGFLPIIWPLVWGSGWRDYRRAIGWYKGKGVFREIGAGVAGYIAGLPLLVVALIAVVFLAKYTGETPSHPVVFNLGHQPILLILLVVVYAPFVEETLFRGALFGYLRRSLPWIASAIISSFIFAILHPQGWVAAPAIGVIGFNLSAIREWRGSAIASMTAHALNNGSVALLLIIAIA